MLKKMCRWLVVMFLTASSSIAMAAGLTEKQVQNYINSVPETMELGEKYPQEQKKIDRSRPMGSSLELMGKDSESYKDLTLLAIKHDFKNAEEWADVGDRVMQAYLVAKSETTLEQMKASYDKAVLSINNDKSLSEDRKKGTLKGMEKGYLRNVAMVKKTKSDLPAVKARMSEIEAVFD